ncbi:CHAD domain-containing protein [Chitinophaga sp. Cy-1792]|uniref:CHAD domain-containing protein n=1 Tax=Chitinophaga sp. Cy-1792 TaxID=2608339 RepID=UPI001421E3E7|nr:CHAD domain-containing protein [Chitinophaga sp. Cy-1792]NIG53630.1 CHAD domain-containing protein [Chitinophaga sp. Cy-1792]
MVKEALYNYLLSETTALVAAHNKLALKPRDHAAVHEQRTGVKKLRAFFDLTDNIPGLKFKYGHYLNKVRMLQAIAGVARDAQLQTRALTAYEKPLSWRFGYAHLLLQEKQAVAAALTVTASKRLKLSSLKELPKIFKEHLDAIPEQRLNTLLLTYIDDTYGGVTAPSTKAGHVEWHSLRKKMKNAYYQLTILKDVLPPTSHYHKMLAFAKKAGELLGNWHDSSELYLFVQATIRKAKKEKLPLPVKAMQLLKILKQESQERLALCALHFPGRIV